MRCTLYAVLYGHVWQCARLSIVTGRIILVCWSRAGISADYSLSAAASLSTLQDNTRQTYLIPLPYYVVFTQCTHFYLEQVALWNYRLLSKIFEIFVAYQIIGHVITWLYWHPKLHLVKLIIRSVSVGLNLNLNKTKIMTSNKASIQLKGTEVEYVDQNTYLDLTISFTNKINEEINRKSH